MRKEAALRVRVGGVSPAEIDLPAAALSGGNQQKLVIARALARDPSARRILVLAQPTRGVDINAARQIHLHVVAAAESGAAVLVLSADLDELRALCHRIIVVAHGRIVGEARRDADGRWGASASNEQLGARMVATDVARDSP
jgi:simple sugar transport system ATP-binding protein